MASSTIKGRIKVMTISTTATTGNAVVSKVGGASVSAGLGTADFTSSIPAGAEFLALIPSQASRSDGVDVAYAVVPDNQQKVVRVYGTPNATYTVTARMLYI